MGVDFLASGRRPRVALVAWEVYDRHAMPRVAAQLVRRAHHLVDFVVVSRRISPELRELVDWRAVPVPGAPYDRRWRFFFGGAAARLVRSGADLVHVLGAGPIVPNRADLLSAHYSFGAHVDAAPDDAEAFGMQRRLERWYFGNRRARLVALPSRRAREDLERRYPGLPTTLIANGVDHERFRPDPQERERRRAAENASPGDVVAIFVGNNWARKGLELALEGLARARAEGATGLRLWVLGNGNEDRYRKLAARSGVADHVRFLGAHDDTASFYQAADLFLLPSAFEMLSLAMLEAAATGLPLVVSSVNGVDELVGDDEGGLVVARDAVPLAEALRRLASSAPLRAALGAAAGQRCRERYSWSLCVDATLEAYGRLLAGRALL